MAWHADRLAVVSERGYRIGPFEVEDALAYMEPPYWYYPVRQSLGAVSSRIAALISVAI